MTFNTNKEDSDHLFKLQEQNGEEYEDAAEEIEGSGKREGKQTKESIQRQKKRKERLTKLIHSHILPRRALCSESTSSDSITTKSMSVVTFDLTLNERINGFACWMKHIG